jgi:hypothetical protein
MGHTKELTEKEIVMLVEKWGATKYVVADDIIDAYQDGKRMGVEGYINWSKEERRKKLVEAMRYSTEAINTLKSKLKLNIVTAFLRQLSSDERCINKTIIVVDKDQYLSDKVKDAYNVLIEKSKNLRRSGVDLDFTLMADKKYNSDLLRGDGFIFEYGKEKESRHS